MGDLKVFVLLCFVLHLTHASTDFFVDGQFDSNSNSPSIRLKDTRFEFSGTVVLGNPSHACSKLKNPEKVSGNILYVEKRDKIAQCRAVEFLKHAEDANASGVIYENILYGGGMGFLAYYTNWEVKRKDFHIHVVEIAENHGIAKALKDNKTVTANVKDGRNYITELQDPLIAYSVLFGIWAIILIGLASYKWLLFVRVSKLQASVSQVCLCLEIVASLVIDPPYTRGIYPGFIGAAWDLFVWPIVLTATLLMTFYWEEAMRSAAVHSYPTLHKMKKPFGISVFILMFMACITVVFRAVNVDLGIGRMINALIILFFTIPITIFYCVASYQVLSRLYASKSLSKRESSLYKITGFLAGVAVTLVLAILFLILIAAIPLTKTWYVIYRFVIYLFGYLVSTFQILAFQNPRLAGSSGSGQSKNQEPSRHSVRSGLHESPSLETALETFTTTEV